MLDFYVGQRVVCVDANNCSDADGRTQIYEGEVYTVRYFGYYEVALSFVVRVNEVRRDYCEYDMDDTPYYARRFRPLIETDIAVFTAMLAPKPVRQRESEDA